MKNISGRRRVEFTQEDYDYFTRLRNELSKGPFGIKGEYATIYGSDTKRAEPAPEDT